MNLRPVPHRVDINQLSGLAHRMPDTGFLFYPLPAVEHRLPGLNGFVSEFLTILGAFTSNTWECVRSSRRWGIILALCICSHVARVIFGRSKRRTIRAGTGKRHAVVPGDTGAGNCHPDAVAIASCWLGVYPGIVLNSIAARWGFIIGPRHQVEAMHEPGTVNPVSNQPPQPNSGAEP